MATIWEQTAENVREGFLSAVLGQGLDCYDAEQFFLGVQEEFKESIIVDGSLRLEFALVKGSLSTEAENERRIAAHTFSSRQLLECSGLSRSLEPVLLRMLTDEYQFQLENHLQRMQTGATRQAETDEFSRRLAVSA